MDGGSSTLLARPGAVLFRHRGWTPVPLFLAALVLARPTPGTLLAGLVVALTGEAVRMSAVAHIGSRSRTRSSGVGTLVTTGPFARCRNPLYLGNTLMAAGLAFGTGVPALPAATVLLVGLQYAAIVAWEEGQLARTHGAAYREYCAAVPRFYPRIRRRSSSPLPADHPPVSWTSVLRSERGTLAVHCLAWAAVAGVGIWRGTL